MAVFQSDQHLYTVLQSVFDRLTAQPQNIDAFSHSNLVIRMLFQNPSAEVLLDGRQPPMEVFYGPRPGAANMEFTMESDLLHRIWLGEESTSQAFFSGQISKKGNFMKAMKLVDLFRECERINPDIAVQYDLA